MATSKAQHYMTCAAKSHAPHVRIRSYDMAQVHAALQSLPEKDLGNFLIVGAHRRLHTYAEAVRQFGREHVYRTGMTLDTYDTIICIYLKPYDCCDADVLKYVVPLLQARNAPRLWFVLHPSTCTGLMDTLTKWYGKHNVAHADLHLAKL